jgi:hypothetical protein
VKPRNGIVSLGARASCMHQVEVGWNVQEFIESSSLFSIFIVQPRTPLTL